MEIRTYTLDTDLTVAEIDPETDSAWHFLPFEDRSATLTALDERYVLAIGRYGSQSMSVAIFDRVERRRTNIETNACLMAYEGRDDTRTWCYAPAHRSVFIVERARTQDSNYVNPGQYLRQMSLDGGVNQRILISPDFAASAILPRDDGRILCVGLNQVAALDPVSGDVQLSSTDRIACQHLLLNCGTLGWFSPDGRWGLRPHLRSVIRKTHPARPGNFAGALLSRLVPSRAAATDQPEDHPDLDKAPGFCLALDLFRLDPLAVERRLILRYYAEDELHADIVAVLAGLADQQLHAGDDAELLLPDWEETPENKAVRALFGRIAQIRWDDDCRGFTVTFWERAREVQSTTWRGKVTVNDTGMRHVSLDGTVGPITSVPGTPKPSAPLPTDGAISAIKALVRERSSHSFACVGWTGSDVAATLSDMRQKIDACGLEPLVFGGLLQFRFRVDRRTIGEKTFFETVRKMAETDIASMLPALRGLLQSYGSAAQRFQAHTFGPIASGPSDQSPGALSEAALTLAMLDDAGFGALRAWVMTVDQEHDYFAAAKVFPAMARRTGFATSEALRFGLWFFLQQWQTVRYEKNYLGLFKTAPDVLAPAVFATAVLEEAEAVASFSDDSTVEEGISRVLDMLGSTFWDRAASAELQRLLSSRENTLNG